MGAVRAMGRMGARLIVMLAVVAIMLPQSGAVEAARGRPAAGPGTVAWITINGDTGDVLGAEDPDRQSPPASMTKMMLALLVMEAVRDGQLKLSDPITTSAVASKMGGSQVYLKQGET